jgi:hypothetical protein
MNNIFEVCKGLPEKADEALAKLRQMLAYCPETGEFTRLVGIQGRRGKAGSKAGTLRSDGYICIKISGKKYFAHRLAWLYTHGVWPADMLDHTDQDKSNNRISNLRACTQSENMRNVGLRSTNKSGFKGVTWDKPLSKFQARAYVNGRQKHLGYFLTAEAANAARIAHELAQDCEFYSSSRFPVGNGEASSPPPSAGDGEASAR